MWLVYNARTLAIHGRHYLRKNATEEVRRIKSKVPVLRYVLKMENLKDTTEEQWKMWKELSKNE